jgi:5-methylcytosine-specific restriction endonuclease McrA
MDMFEMVYHIANLDRGIEFSKSKAIFINYKSNIFKPAPEISEEKPKKVKVVKPHDLDLKVWRPIRKSIINMYGVTCMKCKKEPSSIKDIHVDHVKPKSKYPELKYDKSNLQVLCKKCNFEKGNNSENDYRVYTQ